MRHISLTDERMPKIASKVLKNNGIIIYPTDTSYGLGVNACSDTAVQKVFLLKERPPASPITVMVSKKLIWNVAEIPKAYEHLVMEEIPFPTTFILKQRGMCSQLLAPHNPQFLGFRISTNLAIEALLDTFMKPITATSANLSSYNPIFTPKDLEKHFLLEKIDLLIDGGVLPKQKPSTIIDLREYPPKILR